jgi:hypothetical protein
MVVFIQVDGYLIASNPNLLFLSVMDRNLINLSIINMYNLDEYLNSWQAQAKKLRAERLLSKIETTMVPSGPDFDQETISEEERVMFRRVGLRMKAYLPLGLYS